MKEKRQLKDFGFSNFQAANAVSNAVLRDVFGLYDLFYMLKTGITDRDVIRNRREWHACIEALRRIRQQVQDIQHSEEAAMIVREMALYVNLSMMGRYGLYPGATTGTEDLEARMGL